MRMLRQVATTLVLAVVLVVGPCEGSAPSELRRLVTLSRHGSRAPNNVIARVCPNNMENMRSYHVPAGQLTEVGMQQLVAAGEHIREVYVNEKHFLAPRLSGDAHMHFESYFRADAALRCSQSAALLGFGLYPDGTGPAGFPHQSVAVTMQLLQNEFDFAAPKGPCREALNKDNVKYAKTRGMALLQEHATALDRLGELCGVPISSIPGMLGGEDKVLAIKDMSDMLTFDRDEGLSPLPGITPELSAEIEELAFTTLMERYYSSPRQITYWSGGFPNILRQDLNAAAFPGSPSERDFRYMSYHAHRELLHALGLMLGWNFTFSGLPSAMGHSALHPATTMVFELHARKNLAVPRGEDYFVKTFVWSPMTSRENIKLAFCSSKECPLDEFNAIIDRHIARTGTWQAICGYHDAQSTPQFAQVSPSLDTCASHDWLLIALGTVLATTSVLLVVWGLHRHLARRQQGYETLP